MSQLENVLPRTKDKDKNIDNTLNLYEKITFVLFAAVLSLLAIIGGWSGVLLAAGKVDGGGPLGMIMAVIPLRSLI